MDNFNEHVFERKVDTALERVKKILDNNRNPHYPAKVSHSYDDKFLLSNFLVNSSISSILSSLETIGISSKVFVQLKEWAQKRSVTLRLKATEECKFLRKEEREVESDTKNVTKAGVLGKFESYTVTKVTEYFWEYKVKWDLLVFAGVDVDSSIVLQSRTGVVELKTSADNTPKPATTVRQPIDVNISWLFQNVDENRTALFEINRDSKKTHTPRRNEQIENSLKFFRDIYSWGHLVHNYFTNTIFPQQMNHGLDLRAINAVDIFVPVLPLFEDSPSISSSSSSSSSSVLPPVFMNSFQAEQVRSLDEKRKELTKTFSTNEKLITIIEAQLLVTILHIRNICENFSQSEDYIEDLLGKQLVKAIGKVVTSSDFTNYLSFHNRKIYNLEYQPQLFSYAIRRPDHYPEGVLAIEQQLEDESSRNPIYTTVAHSTATRPMKFSLNSSSFVSFFGDRYVHGYVSHQFAHTSRSSLYLSARARQFSSFILLVGRIVSADTFDPKHAIIIQNKDDLKIPLILETIPTPKEFKDAISSLSPEQQRFCKAFRSMQLESTLFGVCVVQIKPQLEKLLNLPDDSLTKEIKLSQDLLNLFLKYQIPSDLLSYDGPENSTVESKLQKVREYSNKIETMLENARKAELEEAERQKQMRLAQEERDRQARMEQERLARMQEEREREREMHFEDGSTVLRSASLTSRKGGFGSIFGRVKSAVSNTIQGNFYGASSYSASEEPSFEAEVDFRAPKMMMAEESSSHTYGEEERYAAEERYEEKEMAEMPEESAIEAEAESPSEDKQIQNKEKQQVVTRGENTEVDYTKIPEQMEKRFDELDENHALRPTIINVGTTWDKNFQKTLLSEPQYTSVGPSEQEKEKNKAFDLLDALTKSGALSVDHAALHVIIASTHCFDKSIMDTLIQENMNPIEKLENSSLIVASTIHRTEAINLVKDSEIQRLSKTSPLLISDK